MNLVVDILSWICLVGGGLLCIIGAVGLLRLPGFYARIHAAGMIDTLGAGLVIVGLILQAGPSSNALRLVIILGFMIIASPTSSHLLAKAAYRAGVRPLLAPGGDLTVPSLGPDVPASWLQPADPADSVTGELLDPTAEDAPDSTSGPSGADDA